MPTELPQRENQPLPERPNRDENASPRPAAGPPRDSGGSFHLITVAGIPIRLHFTFLLLLAWFAFISLGHKPESGEPALVQPWTGLLFVLGLFACVVLHELGHALTARRYGIRTRDIVLYPIGGVASLETMPRPRQELWIALAGPAVNLVIAGLLYVALRLAHQPVGSFRPTGPPTSMAANLMWANLTLAVFNMLPAFLMDGGRVLRALIARFTSDDVQATAIAARVGQFLAILLGLYGLYQGNLILIFIAVFVYLGAGQEAMAFQTKALMMGHRVREAMLREFHTLSVGNTLNEAAEVLLAGSQQDFPVVHGGEVVGVLSRAALIRGLAAEGPEAYVAGAMERDFAWAQPEDDLETVLAQTQVAGPILVMEGDSRENARLIGMLTQENLLEFLTLIQLKRGRRSPQQDTF
ncbi:MAG TPA: site-2 protease family protein [Chthonomonadaceae bacterium]|nr:site-2 protease family protein [Chthonomonadaceae bacterium]